MSHALAEWESDKTLYVFTSLTAGSSHIVTATSRIETILRANRLHFTYIDTATNESARKLFGRRARGRKLPLLVKQGEVLGDLNEVEELNEFGELKQVVGELPPPTERSVVATPARMAGPYSGANSAVGMSGRAAGGSALSAPATAAKAPVERGVAGSTAKGATSSSSSSSAQAGKENEQTQLPMRGLAAEAAAKAQEKKKKKKEIEAAKASLHAGQSAPAASATEVAAESADGVSKHDSAGGGEGVSEATTPAASMDEAGAGSAGDISEQGPSAPPANDVSAPATQRESPVSQDISSSLSEASDEEEGEEGKRPEQETEAPLNNEAPRSGTVTPPDDAEPPVDEAHEQVSAGAANSASADLAGVGAARGAEPETEAADATRSRADDAPSKTAMASTTGKSSEESEAAARPTQDQPAAQSEDATKSVGD